MQHLIWDVSPTLLTLGPLQLRWYGLLFVGSFFLGLYIMQWIYKREGRDPQELDTLLVYILIGTVIGARLMHVFAYEPAYYLAHPIEIVKVWKGGLASHGGMIGVLIALYLFAQKRQLSFFWLLSRIVIPTALVGAFIRIGNFFNSEILGIPTQKPWAVIFARVDMLPRHPTQLYEALAYLLLFGIMLLIYKRISASFATKILPGIFFTYLFTARFLLEYTKVPQADYTTNLPFNTGQLLSLPMIFIGVVWVIWAFTQRKGN